MASMGSFSNNIFISHCIHRGSQTGVDAQSHTLSCPTPDPSSNTPVSLNKAASECSRVITNTLGHHTNTAQGSSTGVDMAPFVEQERLYTFLPQRSCLLFFCLLQTQMDHPLPWKQTVSWRGRSFMISHPYLHPYFHPHPLFWLCITITTEEAKIFIKEMSTEVKDRAEFGEQLFIKTCTFVLLCKH